MSIEHPIIDDHDDWGEECPFCFIGLAECKCDYEKLLFAEMEQGRNSEGWEAGRVLPVEKRDRTHYGESLMATEPYGQECIIDVHNTLGPMSRSTIEEFLEELCTAIGMQREDLHFWDYDGDPQGYAEAPDYLKGISTVQFILTSTVVIHTLDELKRAYVNIFSCKKFDSFVASKVVARWTGGKIVNLHTIERA